MLALFAALTFAAAPASDGGELDRPGLVVHVDRCLDDRVDEDALHGALEAELGAGPAYRGAAAGQPGDTQLLVDCGEANELLLRVIDPLSDLSATRTVDRPDHEDPTRDSEALARQLAALVRGAWIELELLPAAEAEGDDDEFSARARRRARRVARRPPSPWALGDAFAVRSFLGPDTPALMLGEQVEIVHRPLRHLAWRGGGELAYWRVPVDGQSKVNTLMISASASLLGWGEFPGQGKRGAGTVAIYGGAGLRVGSVRMRGVPVAGAGQISTSELLAGPLTTARVSVSLGRYVGLALNAEAGWALLGPNRPSGFNLRLRGPWINGTIAIVSRF